MISATLHLMPLPSRIVGVLLLTGGMFCSAVAADTPPLETGSGETLDQAEERLWQERRKRTSGFWGTVMNNRKATETFKKQYRERREKQKDLRITCKKDLRRANRDTKLSHMLRCYRSGLLLDLETLRKEKQHIDQMAGIDATVQADATAAIASLSDAIKTVADAADIGVYSTEPQLLEAKQNLELLYRVPYRLTITKVRISRAQTWLEHLMVRTQDVLEHETVPGDVVPLLKTSIDCLGERHDRMNSLFSIDDIDSLITQYRQVNSDLKFCIDKAREGYTLHADRQKAQEDAKRALQESPCRGRTAGSDTLAPLSRSERRKLFKSHLTDRYTRQPHEETGDSPSGGENQQQALPCDLP